MKNAPCRKCQAAEAAATAALGSLNDAHGRIVDLEAALVAIEKAATGAEEQSQRDQRTDLDAIWATLHVIRDAARAMIAHGTSAQAVGELRNIIEARS